MHALGNESTQVGRRPIFSLRHLVYLMAWLAMWQGWAVSGSVFQMDFLIDLMPFFRLHEVFLIFTFLVLATERLVTGDLSLKRSYFSAPMLVIGFALVLSWFRGMFIRQEFTLVYEAHESIQIVIAFFIMINVFHKLEERRIILVMLMLATIMKGADGAWIKQFSDDPGKNWGVLLMWRDGFLLALGFIGAMVLVHYRGVRWKWLRTVMLCSLPLLCYTLIVSYRRTFFLALLVSAILMIITIGKGRRGKQAWLLLGLVAALGVGIMVTDPLGFLARLFGVLQPKEEGSAYIRLLEYPNIYLNILNNPIFGTAIGTQWHQYYRMPLFANFTTLGCHNTYLYWPLRTGIFGTVGFLWLLARIWKALLINLRLQKTEEDFVIYQIGIHMMIVYNVSSFFGLMYSDAMTIMTGVILTLFQLQMLHETGVGNFSNISLIHTWKSGELTEKRPLRLLPSNWPGRLRLS
jgi:O-antigen ligase